MGPAEGLALLEALARSVFFANGNGGQYVFVDRQRDLVIVHQVRRSLICRNVTPQTITPLLERILAAIPND